MRVFQSFESAYECPDLVEKRGWSVGKQLAAVNQPTRKIDAHTNKLDIVEDKMEWDQIGWDEMEWGGMGWVPYLLTRR